MKTEHKGKKRRDWHSGDNKRNAELKITGPLAVSRAAAGDAYEDLDSKEKREGFLDSFIDAVDGWKGSWANFYSGAELMQREEWYWKAKGFDTFEAFWRSSTGQTFRALAEMERVYRYVQMAEPELFDKPYSEAVQREFIARLGKIQPLQVNGKNIKRGNQYTDKGEAVGDLVKAAVYKPPSGTSIERRFGSLRRDDPVLADRVLSGDDEFFITTDRACRINWEAIDRVRIPPEKKPAKVKEALPGLEKLLRSKDETVRELLVARIKKCKWLMEELA